MAKLTKPPQLDALPLGAVVWCDRTEYERTIEGWQERCVPLWCRPAPVDTLTLMHVDLYRAVGLYMAVGLLEATAIAADDLARLLPGAVVYTEMAGSFQADRDRGDHRRWRGYGGPHDWSDAELMDDFGPLTVLHPGEA